MTAYRVFRSTYDLETAVQDTVRLASESTANRMPTTLTHSHFRYLGRFRVDPHGCEIANHDAAGWCNSIHDVPNLSRNIAKRFANGVFSIFMKISPPSASRA